MISVGEVERLRLARDSEDSTELASLHDRPVCQLGAGNARGETEVVLDL